MVTRILATLVLAMLSGIATPTAQAGVALVPATHSYRAGAGNVGGFTEGQVVIYPNPAEDRLNIRFSMEVSGVVTVEFYDVLGNDINFRRQFEIKPENNISTMSVANLRNGVYIAKITHVAEGSRDQRVGYFRVNVSH